MTRPFISFLTCAYRTERYVAETIESVLAQTRADWELIVVDNGNSDEMAGIVVNYTDDPRVQLVRQENKGIRGGVTAAAEVASGRFVCVLSSDDLLAQNFCERIAKVVETYPAVDAVGCDAELFGAADHIPQGYFDSIGRTSTPDPTRPVSLGEMLDQGVPNYIGAFLRETWDTHGGFEPTVSDVEADVELWLRVAAAGCDVRVLPDRLARIRLRSDSISHDPSGIDKFERALHRAYLSVCEHHTISEDVIFKSRIVRREQYTVALRKARTALMAGDTKGARAAARDAYRHRHTLRAAAVVTALHVSPVMLRSIHPAKNRAQDVLHRAQYRFAIGRVR